MGLIMKSINAAMNYQSKFSRNGLAVVAFIATALVIADADACSRVFYNTNPKYTIVARTIDYFQDFPSVLQINPVGVSRNGGITDEHSAYWVSKYGSVVINGVLDESKPGITADGINTAGFAFHGLLLSNSEYEPRNPTKPGVSMKRYGQFLLDNASSVAEAIGLMSIYQVVQDPDSFYSQLPMHIALEDVEGDSAIVEFVPVDGSHQMKIYHGKEHRILTNDPDYISQGGFKDQVQHGLMKHNV